MERYTTTDIEMAPSSSETRVVPSRVETEVAPSRVETEITPSGTQIQPVIIKVSTDQLIKDLKDSIYQWAEGYENGSVRDAIEKFKIVIKNPIMKLNKQEMIILNRFSSYILQHNIKTDNFFYLFDTILKPLDILYGNIGYYLPESGEQIKIFCKMFNDIFKDHIQYINNLFIVEDVFAQNSVNGKAFVINTKVPEMDMTLKKKLLVVKVALTSESDSLSYEYYIGKFLNIMRFMGITDVFALMYGRFSCDFNINKAGDKLCSKNTDDDKKKIHIITEYVRNVSTGKSLSLYDFINMRYKIKKNMSSNEIYQYLLETNVIVKNIMKMILVSLQRAQDMMSFTHYDLHLGNILIVEHEKARKYNTGADYFPAVKHMPHIIDYGRCYIDTSRVLEEYKLLYDKREVTYIDDNEERYTSFMQMQNKIYGNRKFSSNDYEKVEIMVQKYISEKGIQDNVEKYREEVYKKYVGMKKRDLTSEEKTKYFPNANLLIYGVPKDIYELVITTPTKPNYQHDMFKVVMSICNQMISKVEVLYNKNILDEEQCTTLLMEWLEIKTLLEEEFPIYLEKYTLLFKEIDNNIKNPGVLVEYLNNKDKAMIGGTKNSKEGDVKKNEIKMDNENAMKMHQLKDLKDIPKMYYSVVTDDDYKKYMYNEIQKSNIKPVNSKVETKLKNMFNKK